MRILSAGASWFVASARYDGVRPFHVFMLRLNYFLAAAFVATNSWTILLRHEGPWDPYRALAICVWAAYPTLMLLGLLHPVRMLPIMFFMITYKTIFLAVVSYPLWQAGTLAGTTLAWTKDFLWLPLALVAVPWGYAWRTYVRPAKRSVL
jgi:hypothetical protein